MIFPYYAKLLFPKPLIKYNSFIKAHSSEGKKKKKGVFLLWWLSGVTKDGGPRRAPLHEAGGAAATATTTLPPRQGTCGGARMGSGVQEVPPPKEKLNQKGV